MSTEMILLFIKSFLIASPRYLFGNSVQRSSKQTSIVMNFYKIGFCHFPIPLKIDIFSIVIFTNIKQQILFFVSKECGGLKKIF